MNHTEAATAWGVTEGHAGNVSQVRGIVEAVGLPSQLIVAKLRSPWKHLWPGMIPARRFIFEDPGFLDGPAPRLVVTCGRQAVMTSLYLKRLLGAQVLTVHIQNPKVETSRFDLVIAPEHDGLSGPNVIQTQGAVHHVTPAVLQNAAARGPISGLERLTGPFVAVLIGGPTRHYAFSDADMQRLEDKLLQLTRTEPIQLAVLPSRRTPQHVLDRFLHRFGDEHFVWDRTGANPYLCALALATHVIVTGDSVSMMTEASATGRPVFIEYLTEARPAHRFRTFHRSLEQAGVTRPFEGKLDVWSYVPRNDSATVAGVIHQRLEGLPCRY